MTINKNILTSPVTIDVSWEQKSSSKDTLDLTAFLLNESGQISEISDMVFYGTTEVVDMKLTSTKHHITIESKHNKAKNIASQCMTINLDLLPEDIKHIVIVVSNDSEKPLDKFKKAQIAFKDKQNNNIAIIQIEDNGDNVFCVSVGDIQKKNELWSLVKEATCYAGGLEKAYEDFAPIEIRNSQPSLSEFSRPVISKEKGTMPRARRDQSSNGTLVNDEQSNETFIAYSNKNEHNDSNHKRNRGLMPRTSHKKEVSRSDLLKQESTKEIVDASDTMNSLHLNTASRANRFAERQKKRNK